ncbi:MAG: hypothetical protein AAF913_15070 [Pseudomonadota bacterium]
MGSELRLHGGVHKTGTTHIQYTMRANKALLREEGIAFLDPRELRPVTSQFFRSADPHFSAEDVARLKPRLARILQWGQAPVTILSQENMIGVLPHFATHGTLYPTAHGVLACLAKLLPAPVTSVHLCLRDFASFLPSAYVEVLRARPFMTFETFTAKADLASLSWQPLIGAFQTVFPGARIEVWSYRAFTADNAAMIDALLGRPLSGRLAPRGTDRVRIGASERVVVEMAQIATSEGTAAARDAMKALEKRYPIGPERPKFNPWSVEERLALDARYAEDLDTIAALPGVTLTR